MALTLDIVFLTDGSIGFKDGNIDVSGDVIGNDGHKVKFRSDYRFALFIKARLQRPSKRKSLPYALQMLSNRSSPDDSGKHVFASDRDPTDGKQSTELKLKKDSNNPGRLDVYLYGVAVLNARGEIKGKDPQIIVQ